MFCRSILLAVMGLFLGGCAVYDYDGERGYPRYADGGYGAHDYNRGYSVRRYEVYQSPRYYDYGGRRYDARRYDHRRYEQQRYVAPPRYRPPAPRYYTPTRHPTRRGWEQGSQGGYHAPQMHGQRYDYRRADQVGSPRRERDRDHDHDRNRDRDRDHNRDHDRRQWN